MLQNIKRPGRVLEIDKVDLNCHARCQKCKTFLQVAMDNGQWTETKQARKPQSYASLRLGPTDPVSDVTM